VLVAHGREHGDAGAIMEARQLPGEERQMSEVSIIRLYLMRAMYALIAFAMGSIIWPAVLEHGQWDRWHGVGASMLAALSLLCVVGIRYPLQMLPLLLFELAWKVIFLVAVALPPWRVEALDPATRATAVECLLGVILLPLVVPWGYVWTHYVKKAGDRWRRAAGVAASA
jgi:hypothetical protein